ncbi:ricin-type beta-trefoil lectin domain protein [Streptomyces sennicomposti]|uniref:ricin-type beta-trefoil lectin domain protein n=1 Tax=Streptomyces sennicomposti TaxID=2873384 RepID=UPI001CA702F5|nr:ricin-type beta-trefoil lectin domain protein [Streptomyces sennicomposti]MBY8869448.1 ricin-type beta-trefoil lectin domain protein [Streptomyces sennicomposti]
MKNPGPSPFPEPSGPFGSTDQELSEELRKWTGATPALNPVGELLDRHWEAAFAYARLCTAGPHPAGMLTTQAFTRLFGQSLRRTGPTAAWRPRLLVTVRRIAGEWGADHRRETLHPELRAAAGTGADAGERVTASLLPPVERRLLSRAFQRLPQTAAALLWHAEVEAEPPAAPARLLGLDEAGARLELGRARERLREECLQVHRELAPDQDCLRYFRLLDVTYRRGGIDVDPDLRQHLAGCTHCRHTAGQLAPFNSDLGTALAEGVLGWRAREYRVLRLAAAAEPSSGHGHDSGTAPPPADLVGGEAFTQAAKGTPPGAFAPREADSATEAFAAPGAGAGSDAYGSPGTGVAAEGHAPPGAGAVPDGCTPSGAGAAADMFAPPGAGAMPDAFASPPVGTSADVFAPSGSGAAADVFAPPGAGAMRDALASPAVGTASGFSAPTGGGAVPDAFAPSPSGAPTAGAASAAPDAPPGPAPAAHVPPRPDAAPSAPQGAPPWGAGSRFAATAAAGPTGSATGAGGRSARRSARRAARNRNLAIAAATVSGLVVLPLAVWSALGSGDGAAPAAGGRPSGSAAPSGTASPAPAPTWAGTGAAGKTTLRGRLHNAASGLCVGIVGGKAVAGAETELAKCSAQPGQQWAYETDGLLRSGAAPGLCLDSHLGYSVQLAPCVAAGAPGGRNIRYDFTLQGTLVPRFDQDLALTPAATDGAGALVLKTRAKTDTQRWSIDTPSTDLQMEVANWAAHGVPRP